MEQRNGDQVRVKCCALLSVPRIGFNDNWGCVIEAVVKLGITVQQYTGAFWEQGIQNLLTLARKQNVDWVLTIDFDSVFSQWQLASMLSTFAARPDIDALAPLQPRRDDGKCLASAHAETRDEHGPLRVSTAHFGLTLLRIKGLDKMPKPWLHGRPNAEGEWEDGKVDADIDFWNKWGDAGNTLYLDQTIRIGHLELVVSSFDPDFKHRQQTYCDFMKTMTKEKPDETDQVHAIAGSQRPSRESDREFCRG